MRQIATQKRLAGIVLNFSTGIGQRNTDASVITAAEIKISIIPNRRESLRILGGCILLIRLAALIRADMFLTFY